MRRSRLSCDGRGLKIKRQMACKPGSVLHCRSGDHSSGMCVAAHLARPTRTAMRKTPRAVPIWSCSRWGLPCRSCCQERGALLPHHFNLAAAFRAGRRCHFCGAVPGVAPAGRYPAPCFRGARTFLEPIAEPAVIRPSDGARYSAGRVNFSSKPVQQPGAFVIPLAVHGLRAEMALEGGDHLVQRRVGIIAEARQRGGFQIAVAAARPQPDAGIRPAASRETVRPDPPCAPAPRRYGRARAQAEWDGAAGCRGTAWSAPRSAPRETGDSRIHGRD